MKYRSKKVYVRVTWPIQPLHRAWHLPTLKYFVGCARKDKYVSPVVFLPTGRAITGSHRVAAFYYYNKLPPVIEVTEKEMLGAIDFLYRDSKINQDKTLSLNFIQCLRKSTNRNSLRKALKNQHTKFRFKNINNKREADKTISKYINLICNRLSLTEVHRISFNKMAEANWL